MREESISKTAEVVPDLRRSALVRPPLASTRLERLARTHITSGAELKAHLAARDQARGYRQLLADLGIDSQALGLEDRPPALLFAEQPGCWYTPRDLVRARLLRRSRRRFRFRLRPLRRPFARCRRLHRRGRQGRGVAVRPLLRPRAGAPGQRRVPARAPVDDVRRRGDRRTGPRPHFRDLGLRPADAPDGPELARRFHPRGRPHPRRRAGARATGHPAPLGCAAAPHQPRRTIAPQRSGEVDLDARRRAAGARGGRLVDRLLGPAERLVPGRGDPADGAALRRLSPGDHRPREDGATVDRAERSGRATPRLDRRFHRRATHVPTRPLRPADRRLLLRARRRAPVDRLERAAPARRRGRLGPPFGDAPVPPARGVWPLPPGRSR